MPYVVKYCKVCNKPKQMYHTASICAECRPSYMALKANEYIKQYQQNKRNTDETYRAKINAQSSASKYKVYHESPERQQYERNRRYARRAACSIEPLSNDDWKSICDTFNNACAYCNNPYGLTVDHVIPLSKGGTNAKCNIVPACQSCNSSKNSKDMIEWYKQQSFFSKANLTKILEVTYE